MPGFTDAHAARILIVDDQDSNVRLLEHTLRRAGFTALSSTLDPRQVLGMHREHRYDLIILDLQMPGMSGFEVMEALGLPDGEAAPAAVAKGSVIPIVPILVMTADPAQRLLALAAGARGFTSKPFVLAEVIRQVQLILDGDGLGDRDTKKAARAVDVASGSAQPRSAG